MRQKHQTIPANATSRAVQSASRRFISHHYEASTGYSLESLRAAIECRSVGHGVAALVFSLGVLGHPLAVNLRSGHTAGDVVFTEVPPSQSGIKWTHNNAMSPEHY